MGSLYDELTAGEPAEGQLTEAPAGPLYESMTAEADQQRAMRGALTATGSHTPERAAQLNQLARVTGLPRAVVESQEGEAKARAQLTELWDASADSPVLRARLANPQFTELAKDDIGTLAAIEKGVGATARYLMGADGRGGLPGDAKAMYHFSSAATAGAFRGWAETVALPFDFLEQFTPIGGNPLRRLAEGFGDIARDQTGRGEESRSGVFGVSSGVISFGQNAKYLPLTMLGPIGAIAAMTGMTVPSVGQTYARSRGDAVAR